jgi:hypothetical protein
MPRGSREVGGLENGCRILWTYDTLMDVSLFLWGRVFWEYLLELCTIYLGLYLIVTVFTGFDDGTGWFNQSLFLRPLHCRP